MNNIDFLEELKKNKDFDIKEIYKKRVGMQRASYMLEVHHKGTFVYTQGRFLCPHETITNVKNMFVELMKIELNKLNINY